MKDCITYEVSVLNNDTGEKAVLDVPASLVEESCEMTLSEAVKRGIDLNGFFPDEDILKERIASIGIKEIEGNKFGVLSQQSVFDKKIAENIGFKSAIETYDEVPYNILSQILSTQKDTNPSVRPTTAMITLPPYLLGPAKIIPAPSKQSVCRASFMTPIELDNENSSKKVSLKKLLNYFLQVEKVGVFENVIYVFDHQAGHYVPCMGDNLKRKINYHLKYSIEDANGDDTTYDKLEKLIRIDAGLEIPEMSLPTNPYIWVFKDYIQDISNPEMWCRNDGRLFIRSSINCNLPTEDKTCPLFDQLVESVTQGDELTKQLLWEVIAYMISPLTNLKKFFVFVGPTNSGKSLVANIITYLIGEKNVSHANLTSLSDRFTLSSIIGKHANVCMDLSSDILNNSVVGKLKELTGNDVVQTDIKYGPQISFRNTAKFLFGSNHRIRLSASDLAFEKRMIVVPFNNTIPESQQDPYLFEKIKPEAAGIVRKAMWYFLQLAKNGFIFTSLNNTKLLSAELVPNHTEIIKTIVDELFIITNRDTDYIPVETIYQEYAQMCDSMMIPPMEKNKFSQKFGEQTKLYKKSKKIDGHVLQTFFGIKYR